MDARRGDRGAARLASFERPPAPPTGAGTANCQPANHHRPGLGWSAASTSLTSVLASSAGRGRLAHARGAQLPRTFLGRFV